MTTDQKIIIGSLALDLKRTALGLYRDSMGTASTFKQQTISRMDELEQYEPDAYIQQLVNHTRKSLSILEKNKAEDLLMYSTLFQNLIL